MLSHSFRLTIFRPERTYSLEADALAWRDEQGSGRVPYRDIRTARLYSVPETAVAALHRCVLTLRVGKKVPIAANHYVRLGVIENRLDSYLPFVRELIRRIAAANPEARFILGQNWAMWAFWLVILVFGNLVIGGALIGLAMGEFPVGAVPAVAVVALGLPAAWRVVRRGRPRQVTPQEITQSAVAGA